MDNKLPVYSFDLKQSCKLIWKQGNIQYLVLPKVYNACALVSVLVLVNQVKAHRFAEIAVYFHMPCKWPAQDLHTRQDAIQ